ncbi:MAG: hypothetical protein AAB954_01800 [Patescibacteria group bacterium]
MASHRKLIGLVLLLLFLPLSVYLVFQITHFFGKASGVSANLIIDTGSSFSVPGGVWRNLAQGGEEKGRMFLSIIDKVSALKPEYIRIDHVFDGYDVVKKDPSGNLSFDWSRLDLTLSDIEKTGAKPFISISYMPPVISRGDIIDLPVSWNDWEASCQALIEHISGKGNLNTTQVYYEVWNEPDLFGSFKTYGDKNYLELYSHTVVAANRASGVNSFKIGGPATTGFYRNWFTAFIKLVKEGNLRLDFLSWHKYSMDMDEYLSDSLEAKKMLEDAGLDESIELLITEAGPDSENNPIYDTGFSAIHTLALGSVLEGNINRLFGFEIKDGPGEKKLWGRWGILTHEKFGQPEEKPRYRALGFLNKMSGNKVNVAGLGTWVKAFAKEGEGIVKTLVVNYDPSGKHYEAVPMTFINLPSGVFMFKRTNFAGGITEINVATTSAAWSTLQEFQPNSAAIFEIIPVK